MGGEINFVATVLLLVCVTGISGDVAIVKPVNKTVTILESDDVVFECKYPPNESVEWYRSGMRILNTTFDPERFTIQTVSQRTADGGAISRLTVTRITRTEGGSYKCSNSDLEKALFEDHQSDEVIVKITKVGAAIRIKGPGNDTVTQGQDLLLICSGDITAELVWQFKGQQLTEDAHGHVTLTAEKNTDTGRSRLAFTHSKATVDHEGLYTCYDQVNRQQESILIIIAETGNVVIVEPVNRTITLTEGSDVVFECQHPPTESIEWFRSGLRISNRTADPNRISIESDGLATSILTVNDIRRTEAGAYKCSNANLEKALLRDGQADTVYVKVIKGSAAALVRIEGPTNNAVAQGHDLVLICSGDLTSDLIWHFKGNLLTADAQVIITAEENREMGRKSSALTRSRVTVDHQGVYSCFDQVNRHQASIVIKVTPATAHLADPPFNPGLGPARGGVLHEADGSSNVRHSSTLLVMTAFTTAVIALFMSV